MANKGTGSVLTKDELVSIAKGVRNGAIAGAVIRLPIAITEARALKLRGPSLVRHILHRVAMGAQGVAAFSLIYRLARFVWAGILGKDHPLAAFLTGGAASLVTLTWSRDTATEISLYALRWAVEAAVKTQIEKGNLKPGPYAFPVVNFLLLGFLFYFYERHRQNVKPLIVRGISRLVNDQ
jgi:hypothetical protein